MDTRATLDLQRQFFAEEIEAVARLKTPALVAALAAVPRERFLPPGPWTTLADVDIVAGGFSGSPAKHVMTLDADPRRVYHNIGIAIDPGGSCSTDSRPRSRPGSTRSGCQPANACCTSARDSATTPR